MTAPRFVAKDVWRADGHLSDLVLTALADGQDSLLPEPATAHAATCATCGQRLGAAALQSLLVGEALEEQAVARVPSKAPEPSFRLPLLAFAAAFVLALLGSIPRLVELATAFGKAPGSSLETGLIVLKGTALLFRRASQQDTPAVALAWCASALAILALGALVARLAPSGTLERKHHVSQDS
ncbi:MAG: hypothetical protein JW751_14480 [Polyangiaceae bacterium]|nr:hypothetical protein [Polyangiaceae bacterium]